MKRNIYSLLLLPLALVLCVSAWAADAPAVAGTWQVSWEGRQGTQQGTLQFQQDGSKLTGTMQGQQGSTPLTGTVNGETVSFTVEMKGERRSFTLAFTGTVDGDQISGTFQPQGLGGGRGGRGGQEGGHTWTATRQGNPNSSDQPNNSN